MNSLPGIVLGFVSVTLHLLITSYCFIRLLSEGRMTTLLGVTSAFLFAIRFYGIFMESKRWKVYRQNKAANTL